MHIVIAPNAFKGSLSARDAANCIAEGLRKSKLSCQLTLFPIADGGDDTAALLVQAAQGQLIPTAVHDPLERPIKAPFGWIASEYKAVISMSDASGIRLLKKEELNPLRANTFGTGELIKAALDKGAKTIILGVGGSATIDGGTGLLKALGVRFSDKAGHEINILPEGMAALKTIDISSLDKRLSSCEIIVLCDVKNKLLGDEGAAKVFGPQKGADKNDIMLLERIMQHWDQLTLETMHQEMSSLTYGGAAGGIAAAMAVYLNAKLVHGIEFFLEETHFDKVLSSADLVITGEGSIDEQTLEGKGPFGVARRAKEKNIPVIGMAGDISAKSKPALQQYFRTLITINPPGSSLAMAIKNTGANLEAKALELGNKLALK